MKNRLSRGGIKITLAYRSKKSKIFLDIIGAFWEKKIEFRVGGGGVDPK